MPMTRPLQAALCALAVSVPWAIITAVGWRDQAQTCGMANGALQRQLAAFMEYSDHGTTPAEIIGALQSKVRGLEKALGQTHGEINSLRAALVAGDCPEQFAGPDSRRNPPRAISGEVATTEATDSGPIRLEAK